MAPSALTLGVPGYSISQAFPQGARGALRSERTRLGKLFTKTIFLSGELLILD